MVRLFKTVKTSQIGGPPLPLPGPLPGLPGEPPAAVPASAPGGGSEPERQEIGSPLDSLGKILYDVDIQTYIANNFQKTYQEISNLLWQMYGGDKFGLKSDPGKIGKRKFLKDVNPEEIKNEQEKTENSRWERLPEGKHITDVINSKSELDQAVLGVITDITTDKKSGGGGGGILGGGPPSGGPPGPEASNFKKILRKYSEIKRIKEKDTLSEYYKFINNVLKSI